MYICEDISFLSHSCLDMGEADNLGGGCVGGTNQARATLASFFLEEKKTRVIATGLELTCGPGGWV